MNGNTKKVSFSSRSRSTAYMAYPQKATHSTENRTQARANMPKIYHILLLLALALPAFGQKAPMPQAWTTLFDADGLACAGCKAYFYIAGSTTPQATYTTPGGGAANTQPVVLDSSGSANIWMTPGQTYRLDLYSAVDVLIRSVDNIPGGSLLGQSSVTANYVLAGPTTGASATPTFRALVAADFAGLFAGISCTNQFVTAASSSLVFTCTTNTLAGAQHANQGTTTTLLHGNAAGNPSWGNIVAADFGAAITARTAFVRAAASAGAPAFGTTVDVLAYQVAEIPSSVFVASDFTTSGVGTALEAIAGLTWTIPATTALNVPFSCHLVYSQAVGNANVALGIQDVTVSPTNIAATGVIYMSATTVTEGVLVGLASTTATAIVSALPAATATNYTAEVSGFIEAPSNASSSAIQIMVSTATAADLVTVRRGSFCMLN